MNAPTIPARRRRKWLRRHQVIGVLLILLLAALAWAAAVFRQTHLIPATALPPLVLPQPRAVQRASASLRRLTAVSPNPRLRPRELVILQADVNTVIASHPETLRRMMVRPHLSFQPGRVVITGYTPVHGQYAPVRLEVTPTVQRGRLSVRLPSMTVAGLPAPTSMVRLAQQQVNRILRERLSHIPGPRSVAVENGRLVLWYREGKRTKISTNLSEYKERPK